MEKQFEIKIDDSTRKFSSYFHILEKIPEFKQFKREIKLNTLLLDGKKMQFDIKDIIGRSSIFGTTGEPDSVTSILSFSFKVKNMTFIIKDDLVEKLLVDIETMDNENGRTVETLIDQGFYLSLKFKYSFYLENSQN